VELTCLCLEKEQKHQSDTPVDTPEEYFQRIFFVLYFDSLSIVFEKCFLENNLGLSNCFTNKKLLELCQ
jgi:hypothetical protein